MNETIVNLTGNVITIGGKEFKPLGNIKLSQTTEIIKEIGGVQICKSVFGKGQIPPREKDKYLIVSNVVCQQNKDRDDLLIIGGKIKNEQGGIIGASYLLLNPYFK